jgi:hypothetical protein
MLRRKKDELRFSLLAGVFLKTLLENKKRGTDGLQSV